MKTTGFLFAALSVLPAIFAAPVADPKALVERASADTIVNALKNVDAGVKKLDSAVKKVKSADLTVLLNVNTEAQNLAATLTKAQSQVQSAGQVDLLGAIVVEIPTLSLVGDVQTLAKDLIAIKKYVVQAGVGAVVLNTVKDQKAKSDAFATALVSKIPALVAGIGNFHKQQIDDALDSVIKAYSS